MSLHESEFPRSRHVLSTLADGEATDTEAALVVQAWSQDSDARVTWHLYHLIGDVMRSDDLAVDPAASQRLVRALRTSFADEPIVLAPQTPRRSLANEVWRGVRSFVGRGGGLSRRWQVPMTAMAGFLAVVGGLTFLSGPLGLTPPNAASVTAQAGSLDKQRALKESSSVAVGIDVELAPYVAAHRQSLMNDVLYMPGGDVRNVSMLQSTP